MGRYIAKRLIISVITLLVILLVLFLLLQFMPGSPFNDQKLSPDQVEQLKDLVAAYRRGLIKERY